MSMADDLQAVSVDEALIEVTNAVDRIKISKIRGISNDSSDREENADLSIENYAKDFADKIRATIRESTGCEGMTFSWPIFDHYLQYSLTSKYRHLV